MVRIVIESDAVRNEISKFILRALYFYQALKEFFSRQLSRFGFHFCRGGKLLDRRMLVRLIWANSKR